jgi:hypothetical protein
MSDYKPLDDRQVVNRAILQQLFPWVGEQTLDILLASINSEVTPPLAVTATSTPSLIVDIGPSIVANPESLRNKSIPFVNGVIPSITSATATFPSASGGNIATSTGSTVPLTLPSGDYVQVLLTIDDLSNISATVGSPNPVEADLVVPPPANNLFPFAYVTLFNSGGTIQNVTQSNIYQLSNPEATSSSSSSNAVPWIAKNVSLAQGTTEYTVNLVNPMSDLSYVVLAMMENDVDALPQYQQVETTSKTLSSFTFQWNMPLDTANYSIDYIIPPISTPRAEVPISSGATSVTATLGIAENGSSYGIVGVLQNLVDGFPQFQTAVITSQSATNFTDTWNSPTSSANYSLVYVENPTAQLAVGSGVTSITLSLPVAYGAPGYAVVASMSDITDANPEFKPLLVTAKSGSQFTISWNTVTLTANYVISYLALPLTS